MNTKRGFRRSPMLTPDLFLKCLETLVLFQVWFVRTLEEHIFPCYWCVEMYECDSTDRLSHPWILRSCPTNLPEFSLILMTRQLGCSKLESKLKINFIKTTFVTKERKFVLFITLNFEVTTCLKNWLCSWLWYCIHILSVHKYWYSMENCVLM